MPLVAGAVLTLIGDTVLSRSVQNGLDVLSGLTRTPQLKHELEQLDMEAQLRTVEALVSELDSTYIPQAAESANEPHIAAQILLSEEQRTQKSASPAKAASEDSTTLPMAVPVSPSPVPPVSSASKVNVTSAVATVVTTTVATVVTTQPTTDSAVTKGADSNAAECAPTASPIAPAPVAVPAETADKQAKNANATASSTAAASAAAMCGGNRAVQLAVQHIEDVVVKIHGVLLSIKKEQELHGTRWFSYMRTPNYSPLIVQLKSSATVLERRLDLLIKVLQVHRLHHGHGHAATTTATMAAATAASGPKTAKQQS